MGKKDLLDVQKENDIFFSRVTTDRLQELAIIIADCRRTEVEISEIAEMLGITASQVAAIMKSDIYLQSVQTAVKDDADLVRTVMRPSLVKITQELIRKAEGGDHKSIALVMKTVGADKPEPEKKKDAMAGYKDMLAQLGIQSLQDKNNEKLKALASEEIIDAEYEKIEGEEYEDVDELISDEDGTDAITEEEEEVTDGSSEDFCSEEFEQDNQEDDREEHGDDGAGRDRGSDRGNDRGSDSSDSSDDRAVEDEDWEFNEDDDFPF
jgi:predicted transcriptional regulator